jgi:hypothetical protein
MYYADGWVGVCAQQQLHSLFVLVLSGAVYCRRRIHVFRVFVGVNPQQLVHALLAPVFSGAVQWPPRMHVFCILSAPTRSNSFTHFLRLFLAA